VDGRERAGNVHLVGADGAIHKESFEVGRGALLWRDGRVTLLLQGAGSRPHAVALAAEVSD
jgi:hypothetical protein